MQNNNIKLWKQGMLIFFILPLLFCGIQSCNPTEPEPPPPKPPGYQEDVPWPSLADSPWPINHGNPQSSGRSKFSGPTMGEISWHLSDLNICSSAIIGPDSTIYIIHTHNEAGLLALTPKGEIKWKYDLSSLFSSECGTPIITREGNVIFQYNSSGKTYSVNSNGNLDWELDIAGEGDINIDKEGNLFLIGSQHYLYKVNPEGNILWKIQNDHFSGPLIFSSNGEVLFIHGYIGIQLVAFNIVNENIIWSFGEKNGHYGSHICDANNRVYIITGNRKNDIIYNGLFCLDLNGEILWEYEFGNVDLPYATPAIDKNGNIYFGADTLYSVNYQGRLNWMMPLDQYISSEIIVDNRNVVYFSTIDWITSNVEFCSVNEDGEILWTLPLDEYRDGYYSPAIGYSEEIYFAADRSNNIFKIK